MASEKPASIRPFAAFRIKVRNAGLFRRSLQPRKNQHLDERIDIKGGKRSFAAPAN